MDENNTNLPEENAPSEPIADTEPEAVEKKPDNAEPAPDTEKEPDNTEPAPDTVEETVNTESAPDTVEETVNAESETRKSPFDLPSDSQSSAGSSTPENTSPASAGYSSGGETQSSSQPVSEFIPQKQTDMTGTLNPDYTYEAAEEISKGYGIASLVLGILGMLTSCCCAGLIFGILGIVFGCVQPANEEGKKPGIAIAGIITSSIGIVFFILWTIIGIVFPAMYRSI